MIYVYNKEGLNDTLLCMIHMSTEWGKNIAVDEVAKDVMVLKDNDKIVGVNILNASKKFEIAFNGVLLHEDEAFSAQMNDFFAKVNIELPEGNLSQQFVVGFVEEKEEHPDSNKLSVCQVNVGLSEPVQIVCGAANVDKGQHVPVAMVGTVMPSGLVIAPSKLRGIPSNGMICSARELGLPESFHTPGIMVLDGAREGQNFFEFFSELN